MPEDKVILLDTMVVGGLFALSKKGKSIDENKKEWKNVVVKIIENIKNRKLVVPPSVCFELMCWNKEWHQLISSKSSSIFSYSDRPIRNEILQLAAMYSYECGSKFVDGDESKPKLKSMDPITAAYCLKHKYYIITENIVDFYIYWNQTPNTENSKKSKKKR